MAKLFILAGEPSGDLHGSFLVKQLLSQRNDLIIKGWGGDKMKNAGVEILRSLDHLAFMGFTEVAKNITTVLSNFKLCKKQIISFEPDIIVFIDYPGFNLRMAKWAKSKGYKTIQYIAPAVWAWKENRVEIIKKYVDELLVILPFEKTYFAKHGIVAHHVGHPLIEEINEWKPDPNFSLPNNEKSKNHIGLFPGSRIQEINRILPKMMQYVELKKHYQFYIAAPDHLQLNVYYPYISDQTNVHLIQGKNYDLLSNVNLAIVSSGTATLEVALFDVPQVVCYQTNSISYWIAKRLVKTKFISLVNLIGEKEIVKELIQYDFNLDNLNSAITKLLDITSRTDLLQDYKSIRAKISTESASQNATRVILKEL